MLNITLQMGHLVMSLKRKWPFLKLNFCFVDHPQSRTFRLPRRNKMKVLQKHLSAAFAKNNQILVKVACKHYRWQNTFQDRYFRGPKVLNVAQHLGVWVRKYTRRTSSMAFFYLFKERPSVCLSLSFFNKGWRFSRAGTRPADGKAPFFHKK